MSIPPEFPVGADDSYRHELRRSVRIQGPLTALACLAVLVAGRDLRPGESAGPEAPLLTVEVLYSDETGDAYRAECEPVDDRPEGAVLRTGYSKLVHVDASEPMPDGLDVVDGADQHLFFSDCGDYQLLLPPETTTSVAGGSESAAAPPATEAVPPLLPPPAAAPVAPVPPSNVPATCVVRAAPCIDGAEPSAADSGDVQVIEVTAGAVMRIEMSVGGQPVTAYCTRETDVPAGRQADVIAENSELNGLVDPQAIAAAQHDTAAGAYLPPGTIAEVCRTKAS